MKNSFRYFNSSPEVIRLTVMLYIRYPLSLHQVEDILFERGIDTRHETVRFRWNRFGPTFAAKIRMRRVHHRFDLIRRWPPGRGVRMDQWRNQLPLARRRS
jgi:putative transposase